MSKKFVNSAVAYISTANSLFEKHPVAYAAGSALPDVSVDPAAARQTIEGFGGHSLICSECGQLRRGRRSRVVQAVELGAGSQWIRDVDLATGDDSRVIHGGPYAGRQVGDGFEPEAGSV